MKLPGLAQVSLSDSLVRRASEQFGYEPVAWNELHGGIENTVVSIKLPDGRVKIQKHYNGRASVSSIKNEYRFVKHAAAHRVPVPSLDMRSTNLHEIWSYILDGQRWNVVSMNRCPGHHPNDYSGEWASEAARSHASLHKLDTKTLGSSQLDINRDYSYFIINNSTHRSLVELEVTIKPLIRHIIARWATIPAGICHNDITLANVLVSNDSLSAIIDFEDAAYSPYVFCLAGTLWDIWKSSPISCLSRYYDTYVSARKLNELEEEYLYEFVVLRAWIDLHGTLLTNSYNSSPVQDAIKSMRSIVNGKSSFLLHTVAS